MGNISKEDGKVIIKKLISDFKKHEEHFTSQEYKEANVRLDFIDNFFEALGWNVGKEHGINPKEQEVIIEKSVDNEKSTKFIDYTFNLKGKTQFLVEAKKPSESLLKKDHIFQAKSYAFSEEIPFVILTNFRGFRLYDISTEPLHNQPETDLLTEFDLTYEQYEDKFDLLWDTFSREAVLDKSLAKLFAHRRNLNEDSEIVFDLNYGQIKGSSLLDKVFLRDLRNWRKKLAQDIFDNNATLSSEEINEVVQRTLDRLIFLRIIEDREIENREFLREIIYHYENESIGSIKGELDHLYASLNEKYNGLLFHPHDLSNETTISEEVLEELIKSLYYPLSPYNFKLIKAEILGRIFEQYLGEKITIVNGIVDLELKAEQKKAGGVYYTPQKIVNEIVDYTVGKTIGNRPINEISEVRIADIACGSGSFLIEAYRYVIKHYEDYYNNLGKEHGDYINALESNIIFEDNDSVKITMEFKKTILENNIYGVDIDTQAIEVAKMSLYITMLEEGFREGVVQPILPDLNGNLMNGNSIVNSDYILFDDGDMDIDHINLVNVFDWEVMFEEIMQEGGFDCIIGNPPYIRIQTYEEIYSKQMVNYLKETYISANKGNFDVFVVFIEKALKLLKDKGVLGYIVINRFFITDYGEPLRELLASEKYIDKIVHFGDEQIFSGVTTYTCLLYLIKGQMEEFQYTKVDNFVDWQIAERTVPLTIPSTRLSEKEWYFMDDSKAKVEDFFLENCNLLKNETSRIFVGLQTDCDEVYILEEVKQEGNILYCKSSYTGETHKFEANHLKPFLKGSLDIKRYTLYGERKWLVFPYDVSDGTSNLINEEEYERLYPLTWAYLKKCEDRLKRRKTGGRFISEIPEFEEAWYGHIYKKNLTRFEQKKIVFPAISKGSWFAFDDTEEYYFVGSGPGGGGGCAIILKEDSQYSYYSLLGVLNSKPVSYQIKEKGTPQSGGYNGMNKKRADNLYIPNLDVDNLETIKGLQQIENLVKKLLELYSILKTIRKDTNAFNKHIQQIRIFEAKIDKIVYGLYNFPPDIINFIETNYDR